MKNTWLEVDPDDVRGYIMDEILSFMSKHEITSEGRFGECFQTDSFQDDVEEFALNMVQAGLQYIKE